MTWKGNPEQRQRRACLSGRAGAIAALLLCVPGTGAWAQAPAEDAEAASEAQLEDLLEAAQRAPSSAGAERLFAEEDLAPHFTQGALAQAKLAYERRRYGQARALLARAPQSPPVRYLAALAALNAGELAVAAEEFSALAERYPPLADRCRALAGGARERLKQWDAALAAYEQVAPPALAFPEARFGMSRVLERKGDRVGAARVLEPLTGDAPGRGREAARLQALMRTCDLARARLDYQAEHHALLEVWATSPLSPEAERARARLKGLPLPLKWRVRRAEALLALHLNAQALAQLEPVLPQLALPEPLACRAHLAYGTALRKERQHRSAVRALAPVAEACRDAELRPRALYLLGYSQSVVAPRDAVETYAALARDYPAHALADDALFFAAQVQLQLGDAPGALARFEETARRYPEGNFAAEALFKAFLVQFERKAWGPALASLAAIEALPAGTLPDEEPWRARYWEARSLEAQGQLPEALAAYGRVARERPGTYYGMLACGRLEAREVPCGLTPGTASGSAPPQGRGAEQGGTGLPLGTLAEEPHFWAAVELHRLRLPGAAEELLAIEPRRQSPAGARLLFRLAQTLGLEKTAGALARSTALTSSLVGAPDASSRQVWEATYPLAFQPLVERYGKAARVDAHLVYALMREESRFNPRARSSTGALGLTQLMPATASAVARAHRVGQVTAEHLLQPYKNLQLGSLYLGSLLRDFEGEPTYAIASYNAGPGAVRRWLRTRPAAELDEWVELIPFEETRAYVKRVQASYATYRILYARPAPAQPERTRRGAAGSGRSALLAP
ncbi:tetratricopeptide repeat protein [Aggregicoccus sp. 17bor-14]|uniref:transglycosylase SLT domain-containing protein n=1 Tax=Myxococcaceae TaxID=31 RepID=UPI00129D0562|nr:MULTISPECIES: transglycosylase SLT domain-containing protein [Myxococcaceae]MBF5045292.1 transglycosylase SLT domain-containing protein [Simulacricoccus sp. 17bor-14]MRI91033.1 tetratricopeptide repeat protein [Aggregicoccus sp. 17bor-14]